MTRSASASESVVSDRGAGAGGQPRVFALVGNPNCGKTTLFNALTGLRQKVSNYPGVTVERKEGTAIGQHGEAIRIIDLPGAYSLNPQSPDEEILRDVLLGRRPDTPRPDAVICVIDATNADRHLYLATQVMELGLPTILVLNMTDLAEADRIRIDPEKLSARLEVPVIPMRANRRRGLPELRIAMSQRDLPRSGHQVPLPEEIHSLLDKAHDDSSEHARHAALYAPGKARELLDQNQHWEDNLIAARYDAIHELCEESIDQSDSPATSLTDRLDTIFLHRFFGWIILFAVFGALFSMMFSFAELPMHGIEWLFAKTARFITETMPPGDLRDLITEGIISGVSGVLVFLPQILILFFFIGLMEDSGYLSRVAFLLDRFMSRVGLHGRSFIPLLSSYACAVPGIMGTRTIENPKDRLITILVAPFASCSARLPVYAIMIMTIIPTERVPVWAKAGLLLGLYGLGTVGGVFFFGWLFNKIMKREASAPSVMELPTYKAPSLPSVLAQMLERSRLFVRRAGTVILGISILLWAANTYPKMPGADAATQSENSYAGRLGHAIEPVLKPLGYDWRIGVGIIASFAAREVFVSAMKISFNVADQGEGDDEVAGMKRLRDKFLEARRDDGSALFTPLTCLSILAFYVFAMQCASTLAVVRRETNSWRWPAFQLVYMTATAYIVALIVYQGGRMLGFS